MAETTRVERTKRPTRWTEVRSEDFSQRRVAKLVANLSQNLLKLFAIEIYKIGLALRCTQ